MRLLVLSDRYPPLHAGGFETACMSVVDGLRKRGVEVEVLSGRLGFPAGRREAEVVRWLHRPTDSGNLVHLARWEWQDRRYLRRVVAEKAPDVIYVWKTTDLFPTIYRWLASLDVPVVFNIQDLLAPTQVAQHVEQVEIWLRPGRGFVRSLVKRAVRAASSYLDSTWLRPMAPQELGIGSAVFCSRFRMDEHIAQGLPLLNGCVIPNGVDEGVFRPPEVGDPAASPRLLFAGRLVPEKAPHTAIEALGRLHQVGLPLRLTIAGPAGHPPEYAESLRGLAAREGVGNAVAFEQQIDALEMPRLYSRHEIVLFTSTGNEGLPMTIIEAMSCGRTTICAPTGGTPEIVTNGLDGLFYRPGDAGDLAEKIASVARSAERRRPIGEAARRTVLTRFRQEDICRRTLDFLQEAVETSRSRR